MDTKSIGSLQETQVASGLAWSHCDESSNDFRSDIFTKPSLPMLEAIINTTLGNDELDEDATTNEFQDYVASLVGHEAALVVMSGTMGNQTALRAALTTPPHSILCDHRAHIVTCEGGGPSSISGAMVQMVAPSNGHHLTLDDVKRYSVVTKTFYDSPTKVISLENTLWGTIMPISEIRAISQWARAQSRPIHMHLDGARLWEAVAAGACTLREVGECFDSMQLCLAKGLGAPLGSVIAGSSAFIQRAKWSRKHLGGGIRSSGVITAPARVAIDNVFLGGKLKLVHAKAKFAADLWQQLGGKLEMPTETNMLCLDLCASGVAPEDFYPLAATFDLKLWDSIVGRVVFHYQISDAAFGRLCSFFKAVLKGKQSEATHNGGGNQVPSSVAHTNGHDKDN